MGPLLAVADWNLTLLEAVVGCAATICAVVGLVGCVGLLHPTWAGAAPREFAAWLGKPWLIFLRAFSAFLALSTLRGIRRGGR